MTPLLMASKNGHLPVVEYLLGAKADVNRPMEVGCLSTRSLLEYSYSITMAIKTYSNGGT